MALSDTAIRALKPGAKDYKASDEKGLYLLVTPTGGRLWRLKYRTPGGVERKLSLGAYPDVSLKDARDLRDDARKLLASGVDPPGQPRTKPEEQPAPPDEPGGEPEPPKQRLVIKLADGKERTFQHMSASTFWDASGKPISAAQFVERLFGKLPELFKDEAELRTIWSDPETRAA